LISGAETFFEQEAENLKYKFSFAPKLAKYLHQPVISMGVGPCTISSYLTRTGVWGQSAQRLAILGDFLPK